MTSILDSIDGALHDWETSDDAMRWSPRLAEVKGRAVVPALRPGLSLAGAEGPWTVINGDTLTLRPASPGVDFEPLIRAATAAAEELVRFFHQLAEGVTRVAPGIARMAVMLAEAYAAAGAAERRRRGGGRLAVDGREYQRRLRHRRRRRRR